MKREAYNKAASLETDHWWFAGRRKIVECVLRQLPLPSAPRILEVGCGVGANLTWLSRFGTLSAMEPDPEAMNLANSRGITEVLSGSLPDDIPFEDAQFHLVILLDVLEHIADHERGLHVLKKLLKKDGMLVMTVPAFPFLWNTHDELSDHKRRYRLKQLLSLLVQTGFEPLRHSYFNTLLFPLSCVAALADRLRRNRGNWFREHHPTVNRLLKAVFSLESLAVSRFSLPFGTTIIVAARKMASCASRSADGDRQ